MPKDLHLWILLAGVLIFLIYAARVIKTEKVTALKDGIDLEFHGFLFTIPPWWTRVTEEDDLIKFKRTDTHYDWKAKFHFIKSNGEDDLQSVFENEALKRKIIFDDDTAVVYNPKKLREMITHGIDALRVEGTATEDGEHRIYYDAFVIKADDGYLFLESRSSILNGLLETPFFEQSILNIKKA